MPEQHLQHAPQIAQEPGAVAVVRGRGVHRRPCEVHRFDQRIQLPGAREQHPQRAAEVVLASGVRGMVFRGGRQRGAKQCDGLVEQFALSGALVAGDRVDGKARHRGGIRVRLRVIRSLIFEKAAQRFRDRFSVGQVDGHQIPRCRGQCLLVQAFGQCLVTQPVVPAQGMCDLQVAVGIGHRGAQVLSGAGRLRAQDRREVAVGEGQLIAQGGQRRLTVRHDEIPQVVGGTAENRPSDATQVGHAAQCRPYAVYES